MNYYIYTDASQKPLNKKRRTRRVVLAFVVTDGAGNMLETGRKQTISGPKEDSTMIELSAMDFLFSTLTDYLTGATIHTDCQSLCDMVESEREYNKYPLVNQIRTWLKEFGCELRWVPRELNKADEWTVTA